VTNPSEEGFPDEASPAGVSATGDAPLEVHYGEADAPAWTADFTGLLQVGCLTGWFDWCGHRIDIRTLSTDEELIAAQLIREYEGGLGGAKAYATAMAGLCVNAIDHQPMPVPLGEHPNKPYQWALERLNYARRWYPPTIDAIFDAYLQLEARQKAVIAALGKASAQGDGANPGLSASSG
jgi:hypothetical protein